MFTIFHQHYNLYFELMWKKKRLENFMFWDIVMYELNVNTMWPHATDDDITSAIIRILKPWSNVLTVLITFRQVWVVTLSSMGHTALCIGSSCDRMILQLNMMDFWHHKDLVSEYVVVYTLGESTKREYCWRMNEIYSNRSWSRRIISLINVNTLEYHAVQNIFPITSLSGHNIFCSTWELNK